MLLKHGRILIFLVAFFLALPPLAEAATSSTRIPGPSVEVQRDSVHLPASLAGLRLLLTMPDLAPSPPHSHGAAPSSGRKRRSEPEDRWLARDKAKHLTVSALWTLSTQYVLVRKTDWTDSDALPASIGSAAAIGLTKEFYDASTLTGHFCGRDLVADAVGIAFAAGLIKL